MSLKTSVRDMIVEIKNKRIIADKKNTSPFFSTKEKKPARPIFFQPKLTIGSPDDIYEREADAVADQVMRMTDNQALPTTLSPIGVQRMCAECEEEEKEKVQRKEKGRSKNSGHEAPPIVSEVIQSGGKLLDENTRSFMENRMGYDFSNVKIHTGSVAAKSAHSINALAYTTGNNIVFNEGQYAPETMRGKRLLAHELTHVVQQKSVGSAKVQRMAPCPAHLNDDDPVPPGWRLYPGPTSVFHCGFRTILENRTPTRDDPMNECVYDHSGVLVDDTHPFAGCRGTPDQYDSSAGILSMIAHGTIDSGGVVRQGVPAFITSRVYDLSTAIARGIQVVNTIGGTLRAITNGIGNALALGILTARAICNPINWTYNGIPARTRRHLNVIGSIISSISLNGNLNNLLINLSRPLSTYPIPELLTEIAGDINSALNSQGGSTMISGAQIESLSLYQFVEWLNARGLVSYNRPPEQIAPEDMQQILQSQP